MFARAISRLLKKNVVAAAAEEEAAPPRIGKIAFQHPVRQKIRHWRTALRPPRSELDEQRLICVAHGLSSSLHDAQRVLAASHAQNQLFERDYDEIAAMSTSQLDRHLDSIFCPDEFAVVRALRQRHRPLLIVSIHMGNYVSGLLRLLRAIPDLAEVAVIKRPLESERETRAYAHLKKFGARINVLRLQDSPGLAALHTLRRGGTLIALFDVPPHFGIQSTAPVPWLGQPGHLPLGIAHLAVATNAILLPVITWNETAKRRPPRQHITCHRLLEPWSLPHQDVGRSARRAAELNLHQRLARVFNTWILQHPEHWMLWGHLPGYWLEPAQRRRVATSPISGATT